MAKFNQAYCDDPPPRRRSKTPAAITILMGLLLVPLVYEAAQLGAGHWKGIMGTMPPVSTPMLDTIGSGMDSAAREIRSTVSPVMRNLPWNPSYVVVFGLGWASVAALMLRR